MEVEVVTIYPYYVVEKVKQCKERAKMPIIIALEWLLNGV